METKFKTSMTTEKLSELNYDFYLVINDEYGKVYLLPDQKILICELSKEYVPLNNFREIFKATTPFIEKFQVEKVILDKQNLRIVDKLSMEWYYLVWKQQIYERGVIKHRKILPKNLPEFEKEVSLLHNKLLADYKDSMLNKLDIQYKNTIIEAIQE